MQLAQVEPRRNVYARLVSGIIFGGVLFVGTACSPDEIPTWTDSDGISTTTEEPVPEPVTTAVSTSMAGTGSESEAGTVDTDETTTTGGTTETGDDAGSDTQETDDTGDDTTDPTQGGPVIDCDKIDFLFVVDSHSGGGGSLAALASSMPEIAETMQTQFGDRDMHAMVIDTDASWGHPYCEGQCNLLGECGEWPDYPCDLQLDSCDRTLGAGLVYPGVTTQPCDVQPGGRYVSGSQETFVDALVCLTDVGNYGNGVQYQAQATVEALEPELANSCNSGFLRDDAMLVIVLVSHASDTLSKGTPTAWAESVAAVKGSLEGVVMLGILDDYAIGGQCEDPGGTSMRLHEFVGEFPHAIVGSVCAPSYVHYFDQALEELAEICELVGE